MRQHLLKYISKSVTYHLLFGCVLHNILLDKLEVYCILGKCLDLLRSYLANITTHVCDSSFAVNCRGVPQGSILGPLLFFYVTDLSP